MTATMKILPRNETPIFMFDALAAAVLGLQMIALAEPLYALVGGGLSPEALRIIGIALLPWAAHNWFTSRQRPLSLVHAAIQLCGDAFWATASFVIVATHALSTLGVIVYVVQALFVVGVFAMKLQAIRVRAVALRHR